MFISSPGANAVDTANRVLGISFGGEEDVSRRESTTPLAMTRRNLCGPRFEDVIETLFIAIVLVIFVVFLFLQNWRATLIPLVTVPVAIIGTFALFPILGFSINMTSMFGLVLAIGIVVDDAIVVVEAVQHKIDQGMTSRDATIQAMKEVSGPVVAIALILSAVFIPVAMLGGISGQIYRQFALTIVTFGSDLGIQRALVKPGIKRHDPSAEQDDWRKCGKVLRHFQPRLRMDDSPYIWRAPAPSFESRHSRWQRWQCVSSR